jgi:hypothetical protein
MAPLLELGSWSASCLVRAKRRARTQQSGAFERPGSHSVCSKKIRLRYSLARPGEQTMLEGWDRARAMRG